MKRILHHCLAVVSWVCVTLVTAPVALAQTNPLGLSSSLTLLSFGNFFAPPDEW
jgi:hypothetical protein